MTFRWCADCSTSKRIPWACSPEDKAKITLRVDKQCFLMQSQHLKGLFYQVRFDILSFRHILQPKKQMTTLCSLTPMTCLTIQWHCWFWCDPGNRKEYVRQEHIAVVCTLRSNPESKSNGSLNTEIGSGMWQNGRSRISMYPRRTVQRSIIARLQSKTAQQIQAVCHLKCHLLNSY